MAVKASEAMITPTTTPMVAHSQPGVPPEVPVEVVDAVEELAGLDEELELEVEVVLEDELVPDNELVPDEVFDDELEVVVVC